MAELSPMMQQYLEIKNQHKDEILFYRIGDFYEMFFDDAVTASRELDLTLTGKQCGLAERAPMCGVPFHSYEGYVARLIAKGYKVAICEQVEDPAKAKGLVKRDIIRVVTPGTVIESSMLQDDRNNYIASLYLKGKKAGLCFADVSTGTAHITELTADKIAPAVITELCRYHPSEVLLNPGLLDCREVTAYIKKNMNCSVELVEDERYAPGLVASALEEQFGRDWPQTTGIAAEGLVRFAMAALLEYLHDTQIKGVERLKTVITYNEAQFMRLSPVTRANLELTETLRGREERGTLLWVLDKTSTAMGKRMLRSWIEQPLISSQLINHRLNAVEALVRQTMVRGDLTEELHYIADLERLMTRTVYGSATPKEIYTLAQTCEHLPVLQQQATACGCPELAELAEEIDPLEDIKARIYAAVDPDAPSTLKDGGVIAKGYHTEVDELRSIRDNTKGVLAQLEARLRQETGIPKLKIGYNHVFGYFIEVSNSYKNLVPETYIRKQTLTSGERYITQELKELESKILGAHERLITLERRLFDELLESISAQLDRIQRTANAVAKLDVLTALAQVAAENNYCRPVVDDSDELTITDDLECAKDGAAKLVAVETPIAVGDLNGLCNVWYRTSPAGTSDTGKQVNATLDDGHRNPWLETEEVTKLLGDDVRLVDYDGWHLWKADIPTDKSVTLDTKEIDLTDDSVITGIRFEYGAVAADFTTRSEAGSWTRDDLKDEHDDLDDAKAALNSDARGVVVHMQATSSYTPQTALANSARVDLCRNGGGDKLEAHDEDRVIQRCALPQNLPATGSVPVAACITALLTSGTAAIWFARLRAASKKR